MKHITVILLILIGATLLAAAQGSKQSGSKEKRSSKGSSTSQTTRQSTQTGPLVNPDSLRRYLRALEAKDSTSLRRYGDLAVQEDPPGRARILLLPRMDRDSIVLRWAPSNPGGWASANRAGYVVDRLTLGADGRPDTSTLVRLTQGARLPWTRDEWNRRAPATNRYAAVAAEALHGKSFATGMRGSGEAAQFRSAVDDLTNRYGFSVFAADMDALAAEGLALRIVDRTVKSGERYVYRVYSPRRGPEFILDTAYTFASAAPFMEPAPPPNIHIQEEDGLLIVRWSHPPQGERYSGYLVSRSDDGGKKYNTLTVSPLVNPTPASASEEAEPSYTDTAVVNYRKYRYQVRGISPFGDMSRAAEVEGMARDFTPPPAPVGLKTMQLSRTSARITWQVEDSTADLLGYVVLRAPLPLSGYHLPGGRPFPAELSQDKRMLGRFLRNYVLPRRTRSFVDTSATPLEPYYSVAAVDTAGNFLQSLPIYSEIIDTLPPVMPRGLAGTVDTNGVVRLHWRRGTEMTLVGYRVYQANDSTHQFSIRTPEPIADTMFVDTIDVKTLSRYVYYRIAAVSNRYVHSALTPMLVLRRPDLIPPASAVFTGAFVSDSSVQLQWASSPSEDVRYQELSRRSADSTTWRVLDTLSAQTQTYTDRRVERRRTYEYSIVTIDSAGLRSAPALSVLARPYDTGIRPPVSDLRASYDSQKKAARLTWSYVPVDRENFWFVIYRSAAGTPLVQYRAVDGVARSFEDDGISPGSYQYAIKVMTGIGGQAPLSAAVQLESR